ALLAAVAERTIAVEGRTLKSYDGGWADYVRVREERRAAAEAPAPKTKTQRDSPKAEKRVPQRPSELELLETEIAEREREVAELERRLAEDWSNVETLAAHRRAREDLQS